MKAIIWDWNGTLLNDVQLCVSAINKMLGKRNLPELTVERYHEVFGFPVKNYYEKIGFDFTIHNWDEISMEFIDLYYLELPKATLQPGVVNALQKANELGYKNIVLSAMEQKALEKSIFEKQILHFFDEVAGIHDHKAHSKIDRAKELFAKLKLKSSDVTFVGDTEHDYEVAMAFNAKCVLVTNGHHRQERLKSFNTELIPNLDALHAFIDDQKVIRKTA